MTFDDHAFPLREVTLSTRPRYRDVPEIHRLEAVGSPIHLTVHEIRGAEDEPRQYCDLHEHDFAELNILVGEPGALRYRITIGDETEVVASPTSVWIPANVPHSANLVGGTGQFIAAYVQEPATDPLTPWPRDADRRR